MMEDSDVRLIIQRLDTLIEEVHKVNLDHENRIRRLEELTTRLSERMSAWQAVQAIYTTVASAVAGALGRL